jgi:hypothetical protein
MTDTAYFIRAALFPFFPFVTSPAAGAAATERVVPVAASVTGPLKALARSAIGLGCSAGTHGRVSLGDDFGSLPKMCTWREGH